MLRPLPLNVYEGGSRAIWVNIKINKTDATWRVRELIHLGKKRPEREAGSLVSI